MDRVRVIAELKIRDCQGAVDVLGRAAGHVEEHSPGTLVWDVFTDEKQQRMTLYEEFTDEEALLDYEKSMTDLGYRREVREHLDLQRVLVLGGVSDPNLVDELEHMGALRLSRTLGAAR